MEKDLGGEARAEELLQEGLRHNPKAPELLWLKNHLENKISAVSIENIQQLIQQKNWEIAGKLLKDALFEDPMPTRSITFSKKSSSLSLGRHKRNAARFRNFYGPIL